MSMEDEWDYFVRGTNQLRREVDYQQEKHRTEKDGLIQQLQRSCQDLMFLKYLSLCLIMGLVVVSLLAFR